MGGSQIGAESGRAWRCTRARGWVGGTLSFCTVLCHALRKGLHVVLRALFRPASPDAAAVEVTEREDLRSRSPSPELPAPEFPDTDPLASSTDTDPMTPE